MAIQWDESLRLGVPILDEQHEKIFVYFEHLTEAVQKGDGRGEVVSLLAYLDEYSASHFKNEECLMEFLAYPGLGAQRRQHIIFRDNIIKLSTLLTSNAPLQEIAIKLDALLIKYLIIHVCELDHILVDYIKSHPIIGPSYTKLI